MPRSRPTACGIQGSSRRFRCFRHVHVLFKPDFYRFCGGWRKSGLWFRLPSRFVSIPGELRSGCGIRLWIEAWFDCSRCSIHDVASLGFIHGVFEFPQVAFCLEGVWGRLARSETIQSVPPQIISGERQTAAVNATTSLDRDQILDPCELIHPRSGNPSGSRVSCPGIVPPHPGHFVDVRAQSHSGVADRHSRGFPKPPSHEWSRSTLP